MEVIDFKFLNIEDLTDMRYDNWSRVYEYAIVYDFIKKNIHIGDKIHNSSWGFGGVHVPFRDSLDDLSKNVLHSDIVKSVYRETFYFDITKENKDLENSFDFVLNVSTIEHLEKKEDRLGSIKNLMNQLKDGGYLILTFDYPRVDLSEFEQFVGVTCKKEGNILNGENSIIKNPTYSNLNIVLLIIKK